MTQTTHTEADDAPTSTMEILQNEMEKKWERDQAEEAREERLADEPLGPEQPRTLVDEKAFYDFRGGVEEGDIIEWDDGEVNEVIGVVPAQKVTEPEFEPLGDIVHVRVLEEMEDADQYSIVNRVGDQTNYCDYVIGQGLADGTVTIHSED